MRACFGSCCPSARRAVREPGPSDQPRPPAAWENGARRRTPSSVRTPPHLLSTLSFLLSRPQAAGERAATVGTNLPVCPPAACPSSAPGCRASGDPRFVPAKTPQAWRPCVPHQAGQAHVTSVGGAFTHPSRGAGQSWGTPTGGVRFARPCCLYTSPGGNSEVFHKTAHDLRQAFCAEDDCQNGPGGV
jgi:hypothetical protein